MRKTPFALVVLLTALSLPLEALRPDFLLAQGTPEPVPTFTPPDTLAAGTTITIDGAPTMAAINQSLEADFEARYPDAEVEISTSETEAALQRLLNGDIDLVAMGRPLVEAELAQNLIQVPVSREKIAVIVSSENPFQGDLTSTQFAQIFRGEITNWSQVGGPNLPIRFVDRPETSDIRRSLSDYQLFKSQPFETGENAVQVDTDSTAAVVRELGRSGISYAIASEVTDQQNVRVLSLHGTLPNNELYPYSQPRGYVYRGEPSIPVQAFLGFATSQAGQQAIAEAKQSEAASVATADILPGLVAVSPDGATIVRATGEGRLEWITPDGQPTDLAVSAHNGPVTGLAFTADGQTLVSTGADGTIQRWDPQGNQIGSPLDGSDGPITSLALSPDGQMIISGNNDGTYERWSIQGTPIGMPVAAHEGPVRAAAFVPAGQTLLTGSADGAVSLWDANSELIEKVADVHKGGVTALAAGPDGQTIISGGRDGTIRFWNGAGSPQGEPIAAHSDEIVDIDFSPDSQTIATLGADGLLKRWDRNGNPIAGGETQLDTPAAALAYTPEGNLVVGVPEGSLPIQDPTGAAIATGDSTDSEAEDVPAIALPPEIAEVFRRLGLSPETSWWIIPAIPILLVLLGLVWALLGGKKSSQDEDSEAVVADDQDLEATDTPVYVDPSAEFVDTDGDQLMPTTGDEAAFMADGAPITDEEAAFVDSVDATYPQAEGFPTPVEVPPTAEAVSDKLMKAKNDLAEGRRLYGEGRYQESLNALNNAVEAAEVERMKALATGVTLAGVTPILAAAMAERGSALSMLSRSNAALTSFDRAMALNPDLTIAWIGKGRLLASQGRLDEALFSFDKALELDPSSAAAWAGKGRVLMDLGKTAEGQTCLDRATEYGGDDELPLSIPGQPSSAEPITTGTPQSDFEADGDGFRADIPVSLQEQVDSLPGEAEVTTELTGSVPLPPEIADIETLPAEADLSPGAIANPELIPDAATLPPPEELDAVLEAFQESTVKVSPGSVSPGEPVILESRSGNTALQTEPSEAPPERVIVDDPDGGPDRLDLPPEVLAALEGIPADSPDSFGDYGSDPAATNPLTAAPSSDLTITWSDERIYAVWTLSDQDRDRVKQDGGEQLALRLYDVTDQADPGEPLQEQDCYELAQDWYLTPPECDRRYRAEVGYKGGDRWFALAISEPLYVPC